MSLGDLTRSPEQWRAVLRAAGVKLSTLEQFRWHEVLADRIRPGVFSKGASELPDFLSTILHESAMLTRTRESGLYSAKRIEELGAASPPGSRWRSLVPRAKDLAMSEPRFFEACYGGRMGNRPEGSGDGAKYPGRSPIGVTGLDNYRHVGQAVGLDLVSAPQIAEQPRAGMDICIAWWEERVPDSCLGDERKVRCVVNGGYFGIEQVEALYVRVKEAL